MKKLLVMAIAMLLTILLGCGGVDPREFERDPTPTEIPETVPEEEVNISPSQPANETQMTTISNNDLIIKIDKSIPIAIEHQAVGYRDGVSGPAVRQKVTLQFIQTGGYTALLVVHHLVGEYAASAEFRITKDWEEELTLKGKNYQTKVEMPNGSNRVLVLRTDSSGVYQIILGNRTFYMHDIQTPATSGELDRGTHEVQYGESLLRIAKKYQTTVDELKRLNNLSTNTIQPGDILKVE